jgi:hypothetical protein
MTWTQRLLTILIVTVTVAGVAWADRVVICTTTCDDYRCQSTTTICR